MADVHFHSNDHFPGEPELVGSLSGFLPRLLDNLRIANLQTVWLADWTSRGLVNSRTRQLAYWTTHGCHRGLCVLSFSSFGGICETASWPVREL